MIAADCDIGTLTNNGVNAQKISRAEIHRYTKFAFEPNRDSTCYNYYILVLAECITDIIVTLKLEMVAIAIAHKIIYVIRLKLKSIISSWGLCSQTHASKTYNQWKPLLEFLYLPLRTANTARQVIYNRIPYPYAS